MKATEGDFTINNQVDKYNNRQIAGGFSTEELLKSFQTDTKDTEIIKKDPNLNSAIPIQYNADGSLKYTFDNIYKNKQLASVARDYYSNKDKMTFESGMVGDKQAILHRQAIRGKLKPKGSHKKLWPIWGDNFGLCETLHYRALSHKDRNNLLSFRFRNKT